MRTIRPLPEIVRTRAADAARLEDLLRDARASGAGGDELDILLSEEHAFHRMCTRSAPVDAVAAGFSWGETITHSGDPRDRAVVRERGLVDMDGETMPLMEATRRISARGRPASLASWAGESGTMADLAGLHHPAPSASHRRADSTDETRADVDDHDVKPEAGPPTPEPGANYELF